MGPMVIPALIFGGIALALANEGGSAPTEPRMRDLGPAPTPKPPMRPAPPPRPPTPAVAPPAAPIVRYGRRQRQLPARRPPQSLSHRKRRTAPAPKAREKTAPSSKPKASLANLLQQPLAVAVDAARHRFLKGGVVDIRGGDSEIVVILDPDSTSSVLVPPEYLGWPIRLVNRAPVPIPAL